MRTFFPLTVSSDYGKIPLAFFQFFLRDEPPLDGHSYAAGKIPIYRIMSHLRIHHPHAHSYAAGKTPVR